MKTKNIFGIILAIILIGSGGYFLYKKNKDSSQKNNLADTSNIAYYHCGMHTWITSDKPGKCPICGMNLTPVYKDNAIHTEGEVSIDPTMIQDIGVKTEIIKKRQLTRTINTTGIVDYDETSESIIT
ncbi:MAG TPA: heavy metal-binding domain-containing protein, partial [Bacteroidia bacterium]|nr:heavy metal-binding domain-containing protein [Bacteroidia bacterium]